MQLLQNTICDLFQFSVMTNNYQHRKKISDKASENNVLKAM